MAYHPDIPTPTGVVQDELAQMRENFQHLDPLAQAVEELQAVSGLASVVEELQAVSGLASVVEELQAVSGLASVTGELQAVSELAPYIQAILGSRIVEHNLDVADPPNGWYVRFEAGLQVCIWFGGNVTPNPPATYQRQGMTVWSSTANRWNFAALFSTPPVCVANANISGSGRMESVIAHSITNSQASYGVEGISEFTDLLDVGMVAIGRWK